MLRPFFLRHRELLGDWCRAGWQTVREMMVAAAGEEIRPGMVAVIQTFGSTINFHPHVHAIVRRGGRMEGGQWVPLPWVDAKVAELLFRHNVLSMLRKAGLIDEQRISLLLSWKHTGLSVHNSVSVQPEDAVASERPVRCLMRGPVSQQRLEIDPDLAQVRLRRKAGADDGRAENEIERLDRDEAVARIIAQIPEPSKHLIHSDGRYANAARTKREREAAAEGHSQAATTTACPASVASEPDSAERKASRKRWANLIRHIYDVDPLVCPRCGGTIKIISFIHRAARHPRHSRLGAARTHTIGGPLAPPSTPRSPGRGWCAVRGERRQESRGCNTPVWRRRISKHALARGQHVASHEARECISSVLPVPRRFRNRFESPKRARIPKNPVKAAALSGGAK